MTINRVLVCITLATGLSGLSHTAMGAPSRFSEIAEHYEAIRHALLHDTTIGIEKDAEAIQLIALRLESRFDPAAAGVAARDALKCKKLLAEIITAAKRVARAEGITVAREAFADLSTAMVHYRQLVNEERPEVVFCSMGKKFWLQPEGEIGNPYFGQAMPNCGEVVSQ
jgi:hypothetical protein